MAKSIWKGDISFGLVSIPVSLVSTEESNTIHFHLLDAKSKSRVRYQRINEATGKTVPWANIVKGYEYEKDNYLIVDEAAFEKKSPDLFKTIDIGEFVNFKEIDSLYYDKPYYLVPESKNKKSYVLLREALQKSNKVGVAKVIIRTKESLSLIVPHGHALLLYLVHFKEDLREETEVNIPREPIKSYKISDAEVTMAMNLIEDMATKWEPEKYHNDYQEAMKIWLAQQTSAAKKKGKTSTKKSEKAAGSAVDFIALLKASMKKTHALKPSKKSNSKGGA